MNEIDFKEWLELQEDWRDWVTKAKNFGKGVGTGASLTAAGMATGYGLGAADYLYKSPNIQSVSQTQPAKHSLDTDYFAKYIAKNEGFRNKSYDDGRGNVTIGIGHMIIPESVSIFKKLFNKDINYKNVVSGKENIELTNDEVKKLFKEYDLPKHLKRARRIFKNFDTYPTYLQAALLDSVYRGDTGSKTISLINQGKWKAAAKEYLNRHDYVNRINLGIRGIGPRMDRNRDAMLKYSEEQNINEDYNYLDIGHNFYGDFDSWGVIGQNFYLGSELNAKEELHGDYDFDVRGRIDHDEKVISLVNETGNKQAESYARSVLKSKYPDYPIIQF